MGNPYPTKSKPIKIGRKHTGAPSLRVIGNRRSKAIKARKQTLIQFRKYKKEISKYWRGERDDYPKMKVK